MPKSANEIRTDFIRFFETVHHQFVPSAPVVPQDDPTLLFTNAGMNQFKAIFLGDNPRSLHRACNSQKCMRVSGKHNDLEEVGRDHHHHTFFEMLGNWSFGDYYKREAITWAWELLTGVWQLSPERLFVTVYKDDDEAFSLWQECTSIDPARILRFGDKDNFWEMGETGPCGPCSEVHYDMGDPATREETFSDPVKGVNGENDRYREIWNLVFIQYNRDADGTLAPLPKTHVDTGMGFERIVAILQKKDSNYATDLFGPIIRFLEERGGGHYSPGPEGTPFRVIADHIRALVFAITDGAFPSNEGRGYVLRRLLRRASRFGREIGFQKPFLYELVPVVIGIMESAFPEIGQRREYLMEVIRSEEERFGQTLDTGTERLRQMAAEAQARGRRTLKGEEVFTLYDTFGFPMDLTRLMARELDLDVDEEGFARRMQAQRERARTAARADTDGLSADGWIEYHLSQGTRFVGYEQETATTKVTRAKLLNSTTALLVLHETPFYAESGGQVGDRGTLRTATGKTVQVVDTFTWNETVIHKVHAEDAVIDREDFEKEVQACIHSSARAATRRNHTATHLLQTALREALGDHVQQSGSRVTPQGLRFDFTHFSAINRSQLQQISRRVNELVLADLPVATSLMKIDEARASGAMALFGEKYGQEVRVVAAGEVSRELCGGTHVRATGEIGLFHIVSESSIAAGIRRIEAVTGLESLALLQKKENVLHECTALLKVREMQCPVRIRELLETQKTIREELEQATRTQATGTVAQLLAEAGRRDGDFAWNVKDLGTLQKEEFTSLTNALSDRLRQENDRPAVCVLGAAVGEKALFAACATPSLAKAGKVHCGRLVKTAAGIAGGGGGGSPVRAQAGGRRVDRLSEALAAITQELSEKAGQA